MAPVLMIRVETDWYVHNTEFRYVLRGADVTTSGPTP
jgi:hypothetical protein